MIEKPFFVMLTNRCNLACPHCFNELDPFKKIKNKTEDYLTRDRLQILFKALAKQGYQKGFFSGGEPLLRPDSPEIFSDAKRQGIKTALFTNGYLLNNEIIFRLAKSGLDEVRISLNELAWIRSREQCNQVLSRQIRWVPALREVGIDVGIIFIISKRNIKYIRETYEKVLQLGVSMKLQPLFIPSDMKHCDSIAISRMKNSNWEKMVAELETTFATSDLQLEKHLEVYGSPRKLLQYLLFIRDYYRRGVRPDFCPTGPILVLASDGYFHPCLFRFDLVCGHISDDAVVNNIRKRVELLDDLSSGHCFREECLSAYR